jgi:hypothetical protein
MNDEERNQQLELQKAALDYLTAKLAGGNKESAKTHRLNRGDIMIMLMLIERELRSASSDWRDPLNGKRLTAIREKLGDFAINAPEMSREEAQEFRE